MTNRRLANKANQYRKRNPKKAAKIVKAVKRAIEEYGETFRRLATT